MTLGEKVSLLVIVSERHCIMYNIVLLCYILQVRKQNKRRAMTWITMQSYQTERAYLAS
jgi:hypothetical protein